MQMLRVAKNHRSSPSLQVVLRLGLAGAIAMVSLWPVASYAQSRQADDLPDVDADVNDRVDPDADINNDDAIDSSAVSSDNRFFCQFTGNQYTVMYNPESRPNEAFPWAIPQAMGGGWTPELRCLEIAKRLEEYRPDGLLELQTGSENGYNIVCATSERDSRCRIIFTVPDGQDATITRDSVFENLTIANQGDTTQGVNTFVGSGSDPFSEITRLGQSLFGRRSRLSSSRLPLRSGVNLKPFLDQADGGTAKAFRNGVPITRQKAKVKPRSGGLKLQPDQFR